MDLAAQLAAAAPRRWWNRATIYLGAAALLVGGFVAGAQVQKEYGQTTPASPAANFVRDGGGQQQQQQQQATTGKVKLVDGTTVYVETANGDVVTVRTNGQTTVQEAATGSLKNLAAGDTVTVQGQSGGDGTVTASTVTETK